MLPPMATHDAGSQTSHAPTMTKNKHKCLVLCFDGTSNKFTGDETDTNIVQIYKLLDRKDPKQYHYYQPGIGSYAPGNLSNTTKCDLLCSLKNTLLEAWDEASATSFVTHVLAGYTFLMRFYFPGDKIHIFGFSRGAYTARYLTEMIFHIGLLSAGNEEMIRFAWDAFSDFQTSSVEKVGEKDPAKFMSDFKESCRRSDVRVHFLGLFDCVNSVTQFQNPFARASSPYLLKSPAVRIRHAVSSHERRVAFKPALFLRKGPAVRGEEEGCIKEVYFAGNHGDVGGGWHYEETLNVALPVDEAIAEEDGVAPILLSDIALQWMVKEVMNVDEKDRRRCEVAGKEENCLTWQTAKVEAVDKRIDFFKQVVNEKASVVNKMVLRKLCHDPLRIDSGCSRIRTWCWWFLEIIPFVPYYDLIQKDEWVATWGKSNLGRMRKIPKSVAAKEDPGDESVTSYFLESVPMLKNAGIIMEDEMSKPGDNTKAWSPFGRLHWENGKLKFA